jgi:hypothetical protein
MPDSSSYDPTLGAIGCTISGRRTIMAHKPRETIRSAVVLVCGILLFIVASVCLERLFTPNLPVLIREIYTPHSPEQSAVLSKQLSHWVYAGVYLVNPLAAIVVGLFVGFLQRSNTVFLAGCCLIPDLLLQLLGDPRKVWAHSLKGVFVFSFDHVLPFALAMITAAGCQYLISLRHRNLTTA